jgi:hypothetical protein
VPTRPTAPPTNAAAAAQKSGSRRSVEGDNLKSGSREGAMASMPKVYVNCATVSCVFPLFAEARRSVAFFWEVRREDGY